MLGNMFIQVPFKAEIRRERWKARVCVFKYETGVNVRCVKLSIMTWNKENTWFTPQLHKDFLILSKITLNYFCLNNLYI